MRRAALETSVAEVVPDGKGLVAIDPGITGAAISSPLVLAGIVLAILLTMNFSVNSLTLIAGTAVWGSKPTGFSTMLPDLTEWLLLVLCSNDPLVSNIVVPFDPVAPILNHLVNKLESLIWRITNRMQCKRGNSVMRPYNEPLRRLIASTLD